MKSEGIRYSRDSFSVALTKLIKESGMSLRALKTNRNIPFHYTHLGKLASGKRRAPDNRTIEIIAKAFGVEPDYFKEYRIRKINEVFDTEPELELLIYKNLGEGKNKFLKLLRFQ